MSQAMASQVMVARISARNSSSVGQKVRAAAVRPAAARASTVQVVARDAPWLPGSQAPAYLDGKLPGDFGFDPLGFGENPDNLAQFREAELIHGRWCMLAVAGMLSVELLGFGNWVDAPLSMVNGGDATWFGLNLGPATFNNTAAVEIAMMAFAEGKRASADPEKRMYPGGSFDPMGMSKGDLDTLKLKEIKNGRLAMVAVMGMFCQAAVTGTGPVANWLAHIGNPWGVNVATSNSVAIPYMHPEVFSNGAAYWAAALPSWYPGV
mmetsp:Transcript_47745/g.91288  ORF Transcript_47745/g.91288 Transcript_47745/m.91288 type:complete len:265 (-) Transcript_47745:314-1108(-)|eukprot:CAMPEP_0114228386 /NCGR_PEP_ID=MMETSP0058-20121206/2313_1 /TAXON_ID=36894 /ORGANISM="Pyramimonas parkeae, CCMP726" /LENGTH=264 /DNA_ID=CAMNT_0001339325 /DNA_START=134 /DNA_END=928 /DNA_ORIENTATION=+